MMMTMVIVAYVTLILGVGVGLWLASLLGVNDDVCRVCMDDEEEARQRRMDGY